jgi:tRNA(fMet)-specific endonuclease VapC
MAVKKILIDTNAYVSYLAGDENVLDFLASADVVYVSVFVVGELYAGFRGGTRYRENKSLFESFLLKTTVEFLNATETTADIFGQLKDSLKRAGTPLPMNDIWISAHAIETGSVLITYDTHFIKLPGLRLWYHFPE